MPLSDLATIRTKVRRLTRSPSTAQLSDADIDQYINTFVVYDMPEHLRLFDLRTTLTFYTEPFIDTYDTNTTDLTSPLYDFKNKYISIHEPCFIAGYQQFYSQSREQFYGIYPQVNSIQTIGYGDGIQTNFAGTLPFGQSTTAPLTGPHILQNHVTLTSVGPNGEKICVTDVPVTTEFGDLVGDINPGVNTIDYLIGTYDVTFDVAPANGVVVTAEYIPYQAALPQAVLYYQDKFIVRPVPDKSYPVNLEAYIVPTEFIAVNQNPDINQWWQYIAYGASKKVFEDRMDTESVQQIMPEFKTQERLVVRKTIVQYTNERVGTIYTEQTGGLTSGGFGWGSGNI
jgi:hypothetical protein